MQRLKKDVRERICKAALEEFKQNGYADASIRKISDRANISLGNIYRYYTNKEALYFAVVQPFRDAIKDFLESKYAVHGEPVADISRDIMKFISAHHDEFEIITKRHSQHERAFIEFLVDMTAVKITRIVNNKMLQFNKQVKDDGFYKTVAQSFLTAMFEVIGADLDNDAKLKKLTELMIFFFGQVGRD